MDFFKKKKKNCKSIHHSLNILHIHLARNVPPLLLFTCQTQAQPSESSSPSKHICNDLYFLKLLVSSHFRVTFSSSELLAFSLLNAYTKYTFYNKHLKTSTIYMKSLRTEVEFPYLCLPSLMPLPYLAMRYNMYVASPLIFVELNC